MSSGEDRPGGPIIISTPSHQQAAAPFEHRIWLSARHDATFRHIHRPYVSYDGIHLSEGYGIRKGCGQVKTPIRIAQSEHPGAEQAERDRMHGSGRNPGY
jgi:hypothetical protein